VSSAPAPPKWRTGVLWGILAVLLVIGTVGAAACVLGVLDLLAADWFGLIALLVGGVVAVLAFLFMAGILYRVDRYRGTTVRRIELFE
jgi:uncharacterized membrane-anchored protein